MGAGAEQVEPSTEQTPALGQSPHCRIPPQSSGSTPHLRVHVVLGLLLRH